MSPSLRSGCWSSAQCSSLYQPVLLVMDVWILSTSGLSQTVLIRMCLSLFGALVLTFLWRICLERSGRVAGEAQAQLPHIRSRKAAGDHVLRPKSYRVSPRLQACSPPSTAGSWGSCNLRPGSLLGLCPVVPASHSCSGPRPAQATPRPVQTACSSRSRPLTCAHLLPVSPPRLGCSESHVAPRCPRPVSLASPVRLITVFFCGGRCGPPGLRQSCSLWQRRTSAPKNGLYPKMGTAGERNS
ncbi:gamma-glutamylaminecyclotransferase isoform X1 [Mustela putorius furo]|uniref:Gamma-glutamylaminecyclotransferase isoform X1 n=1 Tax=Mustela putorius furo TaxID=9669 RepID=A0A8U0S787_MUSPF|nr:gamma-glutamylaminecyclotransferase isoform X1 [Mustela putorius furo]XP_044937293.1 gamma-glutamylaminecyclotransferase isoform X1 [Mustela putorius furo]XP_044937294.1 gamma-glutamylaminecyclotransferase isoform X1 [Mustela putorius furo]XP_044937295.1 gamma-glutamylaminecyclotransferase isoform X1 [Mustela putorius furo]